MHFIFRMSLMLWFIIRTGVAFTRIKLIIKIVEIIFIGVSAPQTPTSHGRVFIIATALTHYDFCVFTKTIFRVYFYFLHTFKGRH